MIPFSLSGAPVLHFLLQRSNYFDNSNDSSFKWLKSLLSNVFLFPLNVILILVTLTINVWAIYLLGNIVISLFILGEVPKHFMNNIYELIETLPLIISVDLFWFKGFLLNDLINQLDYISLESTKMTRPSLTLKLLFIYAITFALHIIGYFTFDWKLKYGFTSESLTEYWEHLPHRVLSTFLPPLYITFCNVRNFQ